MRHYLDTMTLPGVSKPHHRLRKRPFVESKRHPVEMKSLPDGSQRHSACTKRHPVDKKRESLVSMGRPAGGMPHLSFMRCHLSAASPRQGATERRYAWAASGRSAFRARAEPTASASPGAWPRPCRSPFAPPSRAAPARPMGASGSACPRDEATIGRHGAVARNSAFGSRYCGASGGIWKLSQAGVWLSSVFGWFQR